MSWSHCQPDSHLKTFARPLPCAWRVCPGKLVLAPQSFLPGQSTKASGHCCVGAFPGACSLGLGLHPTAGRSFKVAVPSLFGTRDGLHGRQFFHRPGEGDGFGMSQTHYIYCALCFYLQYIVTYSGTLIHLTVMQNRGALSLFPCK